MYWKRPSLLKLTKRWIDKTTPYRFKPTSVRVAPDLWPLKDTLPTELLRRGKELQDFNAVDKSKSENEATMANDSINWHQTRRSRKQID